MPTFEAKKTLLIGLGSTGNQVLERVRDKIDWEFAPHEGTSWIRFLGVETDQTSSLLGPMDSKCITMDEHEMQSVLRRPSDFQAKLALEDWIDMERLHRIGLGSVKTGAGNIRMIGRLAFLFERNFKMLYDEVRLRLNDLRTLDNIAAQKTLTASLAGAPWQVRFESEEIEIITVGTLCGGTCSGTFIDFGYLLRRICGVNYGGMNLKTDSRAIFTLPSSGGSNNVFASNAYAALTELDY